MSKPTITLEDLAQGDWADADGDVLSLQPNGDIRRTYYAEGYGYETDDADWIDAALGSFGPYTEVSK